MHRSDTRRSWICYASVAILLFALYSFAAPVEPTRSAVAGELRLQIPFWLGLRDNRQITPQVASLLGKHAELVAIRAYMHPDGGRPRIADLVETVHVVRAELPVLLYTWGTRYLPEKRSGDRILQWLRTEHHALIPRPNGNPFFGFPDIANNAVRERIIASISGAISQTHVDGIAIDLLVRTPQWGPEPLAGYCKANPTYCEQYTRSVDRMMLDLRSALGDRSVIYNGLWNFADGMVDDQLRLVDHTDAAIIEYFGYNPRTGSRSFAKNVIPYLHAMKHVPAGKRLFVYGRGEWEYTPYTTDYMWQRYLFGAYLLAANTQTRFKYHASFQVPAHKGRSGGLDLYADWSLPLAAPRGPMRREGYAYVRDFTGGLVVVCPETCTAGTYSLDETFYSPEGDPVHGAIPLAPRQAAILLRHRPRSQRPATQRFAITTTKMGLDLAPTSSATGLTTRVSPQTTSEPMDVLLDTVRSLTPYTDLQVHARALTPQSRILVAAEIDDPERRFTRIIVELRPTKCESEIRIRPDLFFRMPTPAKAAPVPYLCRAVDPTGSWSSTTLTPESIAGHSRFVFRRWELLRFIGPFDVSGLELRNPQRLPEGHNAFDQPHALGAAT